MVTTKHSVAKGRKHVGDIVNDATHDVLAQARAKTSEAYEGGREKLLRQEHALNQFIRDQPLTSVLVAAGIGMLVGRLSHRHRGAC